ncbi:Manganese/iron superoxide dismutase [Plectosphaerella cucumerina]|uniref:Superoxide dismutase n=1 Tax=Plectosphaerella cucumerina TaxID=40658 RepID=A0A8K0TGK4_9PEZI|nr:Manganese/iron superoxide dismutase [Plectosphaerella cucumerina]
MAVQTYTLPPLPYAYNALEPAISEAIMRLHHDKHHQAYVTNINAAVANYSSAPSLADQIALQSAINFNGGGHINHSLFWRNLAPANSSDASAPAAAAPSLAVAVDAEFGSFDAMIDVFSKELVAVQGSGWGWLVKEEKGGSLRIVTREDQDPVVEGEVPIIGVDVWEHAYYLQYENRRAAYVDAIWTVINWTEAEQRYKSTRDHVFKNLGIDLKGL